MELTITDLEKFDPNDFDIYEDAFLNLLEQTYGGLKAPLHYIVHPNKVPTELPTLRKSTWSNSCLPGIPFNLKIMWFTGNVRHSSSTPLVGCRLNLTKLLKMDMPLSKLV